MKIRLIVSSVNSVTEHISQFVDHWLQPHVKKLPSYIQDTSEFMRLIKSTVIPATGVLVSIDVSSLYTNIPHTEGIQYDMDAFLNNLNPDPYEPTQETLGELINIILSNNVFESNGKFYLQLQGTALGMKMAPAYANIFMGRIQQQLLRQGNNLIHLWKRYIDDIFLIWLCSHDELNTFLINFG